MYDDCRMNILRGRALASLILLLFTMPTTVLGATPSMGQPAYQKFFGYYNSTGAVAEASKVSNAVMIGYTGSDALFTKKLAAVQSHGSKVIISLHNVFFPTGFTLSPDSSATFAHLVSLMAPYQSSIAGYYVFDEPYWNLQLAGNPVTNAQLETSLESVAKLLKTTTPNIPSIIVFAKPEIDLPGFYTQLLPPDISAIGFDCYRAGCSVNDLTSELAKMESSKYPAQKLILVPDANVPQNRKLNDVLDANTAQRAAWYQQQALSGPYASDILGIIAFAYDGNYDPTGYNGWYGIDSLIQTKTALAGFYSLFSNTTPIMPTAVLARWQNVDGTRERTTTGTAMENGIISGGPILGHVFTSQPTLPSNEIEECESSSYGPGYFDYIISLNGTCTPAGYTRLRTLGWIYQTQQSGTIPLYSCWSAANKYHFGTLDRQCEGSGDTSPKTLGYILAPNPAATASISADNTTLPLGQSTVIHATFVPGSDDSLRNTDIDEVDPGSSTYTNKTYSGSQWGTAVRALLSYRFTPTAPGVYKFYTFVETSSYPFWSAVTPQMVTVTVSATNIPPSPTALSATCVNHTLTQSWGAVSGATSYHFYQKDTGTGYVWDSSLSSPSSQMNGMFGNYRWSVAACNW